MRMEARVVRSASLASGPSRGLHQSRARLRAPPAARHAAAQPSGQARPLGGYYESLLAHPLRACATAARPRPAADREEAAAARARVVFGSRMAGPAERPPAAADGGVLIAGVRVPPQPAEPDNCCMSGCANCVWDNYRDEMEEWAAARRLAEANLRRERGQTTGAEEGAAGRETGPAKGLLDEDMFSGIPVGIREFMKQEKRLRDKRVREGTAA